MRFRSMTQVYKTIELVSFAYQQMKQKKEQLLEKSGLNGKYQFLAFYDAMWNSLWLSALFGIIYIIILQLFSTKVVPWSITLGGAFFIILGILTIILPSGFILVRLLVAFFLIGLGVLCLFAMYNDQYRKAIIICSRLFECATQIVKYDYKVVLFIPVFILLFVGLVFLCGFQLLAVWSVGSIDFNP